MYKPILPLMGGRILLGIMEGVYKAHECLVLCSISFTIYREKTNKRNYICNIQATCFFGIGQFSMNCLTFCFHFFRLKTCVSNVLIHMWWGIKTRRLNNILFQEWWNEVFLLKYKQTVVVLSICCKSVEV